MKSASIVIAATACMALLLPQTTNSSSLPGRPESAAEFRIRNSIPIYSYGQLPDCSVEFLSDGRVGRIGICGKRPGTSIDAMFDVIAAVLETAPIILPPKKPTDSEIVIDWKTGNQFEITDGNTLSQLNRGRERMYFFHFDYKAGRKQNLDQWQNTSIRRFNSEVREQYFVNHKSLDIRDKFFVLNAIPIDVLYRYPDALKAGDVCSIDNIRLVKKSFFKIAHNNLDPAHLIIGNPRFRALCRSWEDFFESHQTASIEDLIAKRDQLDTEFSEMLKK
jgi:hypothetical protein